MGWSGGGPHAMACGALLPERVRGVTVIAGVAPYGADGLEYLAGMGPENVEEFGAALDGEDRLRPHLEAQQPALAQITVEELVASFGGLVPLSSVEGSARPSTAGSTTTWRSSGTGVSSSPTSRSRRTSGRGART